MTQQNPTRWPAVSVAIAVAFLSLMLSSAAFVRSSPTIVASTAVASYSVDAGAPTRDAGRSRLFGVHVPDAAAGVGIMANSINHTMTNGDAADNNTISGYLVKEQITLTVTGSHPSYSWALTKPTSSGSVSRLTATSGESVSFAPDVEGYYVVSVAVDASTTYVIRLAVVNIATVSTLSALRFLPLTAAQVPAPATGLSVFVDVDAGLLSSKLPDAGTVAYATLDDISLLSARLADAGF